MSYPVLNFNVKVNKNNEKVVLKWFPSEYMYRESQNKFCSAFEKAAIRNK